MGFASTWRGCITHFCFALTPDGVDLVCAYFHEPDKTGHEFGPDSPEAAAAVKRMDGVIGTIIEQVQSKDLKDKVGEIGKYR